MKKTVFLFILMIQATVISFAAKPETYRLNVKDFAELQVLDNIDIIYRSNPDSAGFAVFTCTPATVSQLIFNNDKNKLKIQLSHDDVEVVEVPTITVYSNFLSSVENAGDSTVIVDSPAPGALLKARVVGNGTLVVRNIHATKVEGRLDTGKGLLDLSGVTRTADFRGIGTGTIMADDLSVENGSVTILGTGPVYCTVSEELKVKGMGSGKVYLKGRPEVKNRSLGMIKVINVENEQQ